jgi:GNAT superfamily N-acetyltransferase
MPSLLEQHWFDKLGGRPADLQEGRVKVLAHGTLAGYAGAIAFKRNNACLISVPASLVEDVRRKVADADCQTAFKTAYLEKLFGNNVELAIGPAWQAQIEREYFRPCHGPDSRELAGAEDPAFKHFLQHCSTTHVDLSGLKASRSPIVGVFVGQEVVAAASYEVRGNLIAHIGVLTRPDYRGHGYAKKAASHITGIAFAKNMGIQYQTLLSNKPSVSLARDIGFIDFAETIAVRLKNS